ncbi:S41 family peptidase [Gracilimonas mengyeensis]|uniref:C-terminal processing protease CtpA/Prc, contains a PDZ domain n=1 Tax=Gracilimonas mengyeensis TaxID=1302730 RepID=A0A521BWY6_9BACT|nr:S41 family peptidase [Gracilimonas mengyeensis]SMO51688.1 C-terminal processing protease CtpA/Prc, contains a PDZ domain [Gracilimonas mengyeensis]
MKKRLTYILSSVLMLVIFITGCKDNPSGGGNKKGEFYEVNSWIVSTMDYYYYWNELVPEEADGELEPETFFNGMLQEDDIFSYMSDDAESLQQELQGSSYTAGFSPTFGAFSNSNGVFIIVEFVYPGTPADEAGLKRGDIILGINGVSLSRDNYLDLYYAEGEATYQLGEYDAEENAIGEGGTITINKAQIDLDPVVHTSIIDTNGTKIGYMFYAQFLVGEGDQFIESVDNALSEFEAEGVTELIVDLRYNPGGRVTAAENMANSIVPAIEADNEEVFVRYEYNDNLRSYFQSVEGINSPNLVARFSSDPVNLNLERAYFLTTSSSASASELLINGLRPYMDVVQIGTPTFGKFYGSFVLTGEDASPPNDYAVVPVTLKYANADGVSDFRDGLMPDYEVEEDIFQPEPIGDPADPMLGKALELITGEPGPVAKKRSNIPYQKLHDRVQLRKGNVLFEDFKDIRN